MDMLTEKWFAQMKISGIGETFSTHGSLTRVIGWSAAKLKEQRSIRLANGHEIAIIIRDSPFAVDEKVSDSILRKAAEIETGLDDSQMTRNPLPAESFEEYLQFLIDSDHDPHTADYIAREWFGLEPDPNHLNWMMDSKAIRFRQLNSVASEFENALPSEYASLKNYVITAYPQYCEHLTFRTAG